MNSRRFIENKRKRRKKALYRLQLELLKNEGGKWKRIKDEIETLKFKIIQNFP